MKPPSWLAYVGTFLACLGFAWSLAAAWFTLEKRVSLIELQQQFMHGNLTPYLPKE